MKVKYLSYIRLLIPAVVFSMTAYLLLPPCVVEADVLNMPAGQTGLEFVNVANPGNPGELSSLQSVGGEEPVMPDRVCGGVGYVYQIGKYEVTNAQYCEFLNAVAASDQHELYDSEMARTTFTEGSGIRRTGSEGNYTYSLMSGRANKPVKFVSFWDACRFANWLHNGQGNGDTETGAYTLTAEGITNNTVTRNTEWRFAVTSEDEWYKAAYHKNDGSTGNYWDYPTGSDNPPRAEAPPGTDMVNGSANWDNEFWNDWNEEEMDVGAYTAKPSSSPYGTFDQGGNAWEWNETALFWEGAQRRIVRGGEASSNVGDYAPGISDLHAMVRDAGRAEREYNDIGFRVVRAVGDVTIFKDNFNDGVPDGWNEILGTWTMSNGEYVGTIAGYDDTLLAFAGDPNWSNYTIDARLKPDFTESLNDFGFVFYAQNANDFLRFTLGGEDTLANPRISHHVNLESVAELATVVSQPTILNNQWYDVKLILSQDNVSAYVDRQLAAYASGLPFTEGFFGLIADDPVVHYDDIVVTTRSNVFFPDYMPLDSNEYGVKTFEWTYGGTGEYTSAIGGDETVPYESGPVSGVTLTNYSDWGTAIVSNDANCVKFLGGGEWYLSTDTSLSAPPPGYTFASLCDGMIIEQGEHYNVKKDLSNWEKVDNQMLLINIQDVTVPQGHHLDTVVIWYLDTDFAFTPIDFHGKETELGIIMPSNNDTNGYAVTAFEIYALRMGIIAQGDIDAATGSLNNLAELKEIYTSFSDGFEIGHISSPPWLLEGDSNWSVSTSEAHLGLYSAQAGSIGDDQFTSLILEGDFPEGQISFWRKVSSEDGYDCLRFYIDGMLVGEWSGDENWDQIFSAVTGGWHTFEWRYEKDGSVSRGDDTAWVDDVVLGLLPNESDDEISGTWVKYSGNPILSPGGAADWDFCLAGTVSVLCDPQDADAPFKMWYVGGEIPDGEGAAIGYATSSNGVIWTKHQANPVMRSGSWWDNHGYSGISVVQDGSTYKLWYEGRDGDNTNRIGLATSLDGIYWEPYVGNPVFSTGYNNAWDSDDVGNPCVIKEGATYRMWYWGDDILSGIDQIGLAISENGISWQRARSEPVVTANRSIWWENGEGVGSPCVVKHASGYAMVYHAADQSGISRMGFATSPDGIAWNKENEPLLPLGNDGSWDSLGMFPVSLMEDGLHLKLWYCGVDPDETIRVGLAEFYDAP